VDRRHRRRCTQGGGEVGFLAAFDWHQRDYPQYDALHLDHASHVRVKEHGMFTTRKIGLVLVVLPALILTHESNSHRRAQAADEPAAKVVQGRLEGRFTAADTGKPLAGAKIRLLTQGVPGKPPFVEALSDAQGRYALELPLGHCNLFGVKTPPGYYTQDPKTSGVILTTAAEPVLVRDFVLQPGSAWRVELQGVDQSKAKEPYFMALPRSDRVSHTVGELINAIGDAEGKAVVTLPPTGIRYFIDCYLSSLPSPYELPKASLEIDAGFDPRRVQGVPEALPERKASRLRDAAGRTAVVEGVEVAVESGQAVLRFQAKSMASGPGITLRGAAVDESGKPIAGVKFTAAVYTPKMASMSKLDATTDAQGKFELADVRLSSEYFDPKSRVQMLAVKAGFDGVETQNLNLLQVKRTGVGDFGTVVLKPGHALRGRVVDENGRPSHGAVVMNMTNYFLYSHLSCRTDSEGRFVMPDLSYGSQKLVVRYGKQMGQADFKFDAKHTDCLVTVGLTSRLTASKSKAASSAPVQRPEPAVLKAVRQVPHPKRDGSWDLTPPHKEPKYQHEPRYALLVFGPKREQRVWMVLDGGALYVDRNANGDLTEADEKVNPKVGDPTQIGNPGMYIRMDEYEFTVKTGTEGSSKFKFWLWIRAEKHAPTNDFEKKLHAHWQKLRHQIGTLYRLEGLGQGQTPLIFMPRPSDAQVCAMDGSLTFVEKMPEHQMLKRGEAGGHLAFHIVVTGYPYRGAEHPLYNPLATKEVPEGAHLEVEIEYPGKEANAPPLRRKYLLKQRC
jgi:protocatechuate 3,4-dioxygenase beta subunit